MSSDKMQKLVRMANQIGDYFKAMPEEEATKGAAEHLRLYWTPKMCDEIIAFADGGGAGLNPVAASAVTALKRDARDHNDDNSTKVASRSP